MDISRYTGPISAAWLDAIHSRGYGLVIVQAHPAGYGQETSLQQMQTLHAAGFRWQAYVYEYLADPSWTDGALATLDTARQQFGAVPEKLWLDSEDVSNAALRMSPSQRVLAMAANFDKLDAWGVQNGIKDPATGQYTGKWWYDAYLPGLAPFPDRDLWASQYDGIANAAAVTLFAGWTRAAMKQQMGTSTLAGVGEVDLDVTAG